MIHFLFLSVSLFHCSSKQAMCQQAELPLALGEQEEDKQTSRV